jgi:hypothetical protein
MRQEQYQRAATGPPPPRLPACLGSCPRQPRRWRGAAPCCAALTVAWPWFFNILVTSLTPPTPQRPPSSPLSCPPLTTHPHPTPHSPRQSPPSPQPPTPQPPRTMKKQLTRGSPARGARPGAWPPACRGAAQRCRSQSRTCVCVGGGVPGGIACSLQPLCQAMMGGRQVQARTWARSQPRPSVRAASSPHFLPAAVHHPVVSVKGQAVAQQVEQAGLGGVVLRAAPAGSSREVPRERVYFVAAGAQHAVMNGWHAAAAAAPPCG